VLTSFRVANHRSIRDEQELLFMPSYDKARPVVPVTAIFGANASGKSNLLDALHFMQTAVRGSYARWEAGAGVPRTPFRLDKTRTEPSLYSIEIVIDGTRYTYGFTVDDDRVLEEWLYTYPHRRRRVIFERDRDSIQLGSTIPDQKTRADLLAALTRSNSLLLTVGAQANQQEVAPIYEWFRTGLTFAGDQATGDIQSRIQRTLAADSPGRPGLIALLRAADLGIVDVRLDSSRTALLLDRMCEAEAMAHSSSAAYAHARSRLDALLNEPGPGQADEIEIARADQAARDCAERSMLADATRARIVQELEQGGRESEFVFLHGANLVPLTLEEQSAGTRAWMSLVAGALEALDRGGVLVVDEIDASLHPALTAQLVGMFQDGASNERGAQLAFTTHDASLLGTSIGEDILERDQVWFVEKSDKGASRIYPLTDFYPRKHENTERRYLGGSYGAVPFITEGQFRRPTGGAAS
jgi:predicted ATPase